MFKKKVLRIANKIMGSIANELFWRYRHIFDKEWAKNYISPASLTHNHRKFLVEKISQHEPFSNVLEIGCASGANLYLLAKKYPEKYFYGIDISRKAISLGRIWLKTNNLNNVALTRSNFDSLRHISSKSIDVIFSDAALIYIGPNKIEHILAEIIRVARKSIILNEWQNGNKSIYVANHWSHNYFELFRKLSPQSRLILTKINGKIWPGNWAKYGFIIEVEI